MATLQGVAMNVPNPHGNPNQGVNMSAYIVSNTHINALVTFAIDARVSFYFANERTEITARNAAEIGRALMDENVRSVATRYRSGITREEQTAGNDYLFKRFNTPLTPVEAIKACHNLSYQSCETDDWEATKAHRILDAIQDKAVTQLPGYEKAPWGIDSDKGLTNEGRTLIPLSSLIR
jgi:hypothetical protein